MRSHNIHTYMSVDLATAVLINQKQLSVIALRKPIGSMFQRSKAEPEGRQRKSYCFSDFIHQSVLGE